MLWPQLKTSPEMLSHWWSTQGNVTWPFLPPVPKTSWDHHGNGRVMKMTLIFLHIVEVVFPGQSLQPERWKLISFIKDENKWVNSSGTSCSDDWCFKKNVKSCYSQQNCFPPPLLFWACMQYTVCMLFPSMWWGSNPCPQQQVSPRKAGKEGITINQPCLGEGLEKCWWFCLSLEMMGSLVPVEKLCCKLCFSDRWISACIEKILLICWADTLTAIKQICVCCVFFPK